MQFIIVGVIVFCLWSIWPALGLQPLFLLPLFCCKAVCYRGVDLVKRFH